MVSNEPVRLIGEETARGAPVANRASLLGERATRLGDPEPLLDRQQHQYFNVRGEPIAVKSNMHRLARHRWQSPHGGPRYSVAFG